MNKDSSAILADCSAADASREKNGFYRLTGAECKQLYSLKLLDAPAYILLIVKCHGKAGWKWTFTVKDFCKNWGLNERTFYRAVSKLRELSLLCWETKDTITVWHGADIAREPDKSDMSINALTPMTVEMTIDGTDKSDMSINALTPMTVGMTPMAVGMTGVTVPVTPMTSEKAETVAVNDFENAPDYIQTSTDSPESVEEESPAVAPLGGATLVDSQEEELDKRECGTTNSDFLHHTQEIKLTDDELKTHLDAAVKGVMPSDDVIGQLRDSDYWVCFRQAAKVHNWDLGQLSQSEVPAHLKEQMRSLREKFKRRKF